MKMMNKFCALMLSVALCAGMAAPAFAYQPLGHSDKELFQFISGRNCRNVSCYRNSLSPKRKKIIKFLFKRISRWTKHFRNYYRLTLIFHP